VEVVDSMYKVPVEPADAVIVSCGGFPKDINLFQANKALDNATQAVKAGGSIILVAECAEGIGNQVYECWNRECRSPDDAIERFKQCFEFGGHKTAIIAKISKKFKLYLVSKLQDEQIRSAFFTPMASVNDALSAVLSENPDAKIHLMPHGGQTLPVRKETKGK
jgi:nickel-dependent lactate racemase